MSEWLDMLEENLRKSCWIIVYPDYQGYRAIPYRSFDAALKTLKEQCECGVYAVMLQKGVFSFGETEIQSATKSSDR